MVKRGHSPSQLQCQPASQQEPGNRDDNFGICEKGGRYHEWHVKGANESAIRRGAVRPSRLQQQWTAI